MQLGSTVSDYSKSVDDLNVENPHNGSAKYSKDMVRLFINAGKRNKIRAKDIVGAFSGETNVPGDVIGEIDLYDDFVYVDVPYEYAKDIIEGMRNKKIKGKRIIVEKAKKPKFKNKKIR